MKIVGLALSVLLVSCGQAVDGNATASAPQASPAQTSQAQPQPAQTEAMREYAAANDRMHAAMGQIDADPDVAFVRGMIPHHRGAIDMAQIVLKHGKDAETRRLAQEIIAAQQGEIAQMEAWLTKKGLSTAVKADPHSGH